MTEVKTFYYESSSKLENKRGRKHLITLAILAFAVATPLELMEPSGTFYGLAGVFAAFTLFLHLLYMVIGGRTSLRYQNGRLFVGSGSQDKEIDPTEIRALRINKNGTLFFRHSMRLKPFVLLLGDEGNAAHKKLLAVIEVRRLGYEKSISS